MSTYIPVFTSPEGESKILHSYQAILDRWPISYKELAVSTSFGETHVIASGPQGAPTVVLLHALFATAASWYRNVEVLSQTYRVYAVDVRGEGNKSCPVKPITSMDGFLQWFTELIDGLAIDTLYLVGNSYGGFTAAYYAMKLPERIRKLVLIGPAATIHSMMPFYVHMFIPKAMYAFFPKLPGSKIHYEPQCGLDAQRSAIRSALGAVVLSLNGVWRIGQPGLPARLFERGICSDQSTDTSHPWRKRGDIQ